MSVCMCVCVCSTLVDAQYYQEYIGGALVSKAHWGYSREFIVLNNVLLLSQCIE